MRPPLPQHRSRRAARRRGPGSERPHRPRRALALIEPLLEAVRDSGKLRLADVAELNPSFDIDGRTAKAAARLIHRLTLDT
ncbi:arginase family protein [Halomonas sp. E19]|uniref:arginase family protein n=1 Tax=Halomonas sp. E19 TaxID=3397247 RepID=UPI004034C934